MKPNHIIIVQDDLKMILLLREMLLRLYPHCDLSIFSKGAAALDHIHSDGGDLLIAADSNDGCSGIDLIRELRRRRINIPALLISKNHENYEQAMIAGASDFVDERSGPEMIEAHIRAIIEILSPRPKRKRKPVHLTGRPHLVHSLRKIGAH